MGPHDTLHEMDERLKKVVNLQFFNSKRKDMK